MSDITIGAIGLAIIALFCLAGNVFNVFTRLKVPEAAEIQQASSSALLVFIILGAIAAFFIFVLPRIPVPGG